MHQWMVKKVLLSASTNMFNLWERGDHEDGEIGHSMEKCHYGRVFVSGASLKTRKLTDQLLHDVLVFVFVRPVYFVLHIMVSLKMQEYSCVLLLASMRCRYGNLG